MSVGYFNISKTKIYEMLIQYTNKKVESVLLSLE